MLKVDGKPASSAFLAIVRLFSPYGFYLPFGLALLQTIAYYKYNLNGINSNRIESYMQMHMLFLVFAECFYFFSFFFLLSFQYCFILFDHDYLRFVLLSCQIFVWTVRIYYCTWEIFVEQNVCALTHFALPIWMQCTVPSEQRNINWLFSPFILIVYMQFSFYMVDAWSA